MTSIILAGGENRRLPFNKSLVVVDGETIIERILNAHRKFFKNIIISTNDPEIYFKYGTRMVGDVLNIRGPMTGILSSMISDNSQKYFVSACDVPFLNKELIGYIVSLDSDHDAVVPEFNGEPQPLLGVYNKRLSDRLYDNVKGDRRGMRRFLSEIDTYMIKEDKVRELDPEGRSFININTMEDLKKVQGGIVC
ncbi:MAG: molybdenum cofactor guanylyltransferase [Thermodesulfovibrionales bacterium]